MIYNILQPPIYQADTYLTKYNMTLIVIFKHTICTLIIQPSTLIVMRTVSLQRTFPGISSYLFRLYLGILIVLKVYIRKTEQQIVVFSFYSLI